MYALRPERDVEVCEGRFVATSTEPWLTLDGWPARWAGRFVEITYRLSLLDEPVRPLLRFRLSDGTVLHRIAPAPVLGAAIWIGRVPAGTVVIEISPTNRLGTFNFRIERIRTRSWAALVLQGLRQAPRPARSAVLTRLIGWHDESDVNLAWAIGATGFDDYRNWAASRTRAFEPEGIDRPRGAVSAIEIVRLDDPTASPSPLWGRDRDGGGGRARTSLSSPAPSSRRREPPPLTPPHKGEGECGGAVAGNDQADQTVVIGAHDELLPGAMAYVAEQAIRYPQVRLFYGDALYVCGAAAVPFFRPGWSPQFEAARSFLRPPLVVRDLHLWSETERAAFPSTGRLPADWVSSLVDHEIRPLRRLLTQTCDPAPRAPSPACGRRWPDEVGSDEGRCRSGAGQRQGGQAPHPTPLRGATFSRRREKAETTPGFSEATIIIPTRDHPALLRRAIASIRAYSPPGPRIIIVDNASVTDDARETLAELAQEPDIEVLPYPGAFNFSAICNAAAAQARTDVLVFLNDDTEMLTEGWFDRLTALAMQPDVGAVGAKLTYPDGRLQHIGVVAGLGESAGHFGALEAADSPGWAERNLAVHEVSAVTGACLAVERQKFEAVGGFDALHLPVELSDIDLCFKLNARGWQTLVDPFAHLMHAESASRGGATFRRLSVHAAERAIFCERWRHVLRDDPFFHPALSLYSLQEALG